MTRDSGHIPCGPRLSPYHRFSALFIVSHPFAPYTRPRRRRGVVADLWIRLVGLTRMRQVRTRRDSSGNVPVASVVYHRTGSGNGRFSRPIWRFSILGQSVDSACMPTVFTLPHFAAKRTVSCCFADQMQTRQQSPRSPSRICALKVRVRVGKLSLFPVTTVRRFGLVVQGDGRNRVRSDAQNGKGR